MSVKSEIIIEFQWIVGNWKIYTGKSAIIYIDILNLFESDPRVIRHWQNVTTVVFFDQEEFEREVSKSFPM